MTCKKPFFALVFMFGCINGQSLKHLVNSGNSPVVNGNVLDLSNYKLSDINGIENYPGIQRIHTLILKDNKIRSLGPLINLYKKYKTQLECLDICSNKIDNISALTLFKKSLKTLYGENNKLNRDQLMNILRKLRLLDLRIEFNPIEDPEFLVNEAAGIRNKNYLDVIKYKREIRIQNAVVFKLDSDEIECAICLDRGNQNDLYSTICFHPFHGECLNRWITVCRENRRRATCPYCKQNLIRRN